MLSKDDKFKKIAAIVTICSFMMTLSNSTAWASSPDVDEITIIIFANRLGELIPACCDEEFSSEQLVDIYSKGESLKSELTEASAALARQVNQSECSFIKLTAFACLLLGTQAVLSLVTAYIRITITPPETTLSTIRAYLRIARKAIYMLAVTPKAIANSLLMQLQYWQCRRELGAEDLSNVRP